MPVSAADPCQQPGADHRRPRLRRDLRRPGQQRAAQHGDRGVGARRPHQDRSAVVPEPAAEPAQRPARTQCDDGEQHGRRQQREHAERLTRQHERDLVRGEPQRDGRGEGPVERQPVARGPADGRGGRNEKRIARQHRPRRGGTQDPQPGDAVGLGGDVSVAAGRPAGARGGSRRSASQRRAARRRRHAEGDARASCGSTPQRSTVSTRRWDQCCSSGTVGRARVCSSSDARWADAGRYGSGPGTAGSSAAGGNDPVPDTARCEPVPSGAAEGEPLWNNPAPDNAPGSATAR